MEEIKLGTFTQEDLKEEVGSEEIVNLPQKSKKITLKDIDLTNRFTGISDGTKVAKPCHFAAREGLSEIANDGFYLLHAVGDIKSEALKNDQSILYALSYKIINTPLDELDEKVARELIDEIRWPYETINDIFHTLAEHDFFVKIDNKTRLNTSIDNLFKRPLYVKLQSAIDELNKRGVTLKTDNQDWINIIKEHKKNQLEAKIRDLKAFGTENANKIANALEEDLKNMSDPNYVDIDYVARKDVLLEFASVGHLFKCKLEDETDEMKADSKAMGRLWNDIMDTEPQNIDFDATIEKIKAIRYKYEKPWRKPDLRDYLDDDEKR
ncbi:hypothetical protein OFO03_01010 [Campylobacter sp. JMF_02 ED1]|uniref:hypothetical protein n=1 Tax=unclassified Campylobacter TaxID=2593542 RepID=UPI0022E9FFDD|nr:MULTISPECIES: hypothetical protein [unclassified Campylobacter]MDA3048802.1 hypothetical protein [Campylobacter sp. JMF_15 NE4]MDA3050487.1 hypothetical protein [Campylobacter sp. JMF_02 ED1]